jgi:hypothetical protein
MDTIHQGELEAVSQRFSAELQRQVEGTLPKEHVYQMEK